MRKGLLTITLLALAAISPALAQRGGTAEAQFQAAQHKEQVEGDLRAAIQLYQKVADSKDSSRAMAAQALLRVGRCYETLGSAEARKAYERVVRQYGDQAQFVNEARSRLAAGNSAGHRSGDLSARLLFRLREPAGPLQAENVASDGRTVFRFMLDELYITKGCRLVAVDIASGKQRTLFESKSWPFGLYLSPDGHKLAFSLLDTSIGPGGGSGWKIYVLDLDSTRAQQFYSESRPLTKAQVILRGWSPDGNELLFSTSYGGNAQSTGADAPFRLKLLSLKDRSVRTWKDFGITAPLHRIGNTSFSPDGRYLVYDFPSQNAPGKRAIWLLARDANEGALLMGGPENSSVLGWTPDGKDLLFASDRRGPVDAYRVGVVDGKVTGVPVLIKTDIGAVRPLGFGLNGAFFYINQGTSRAVLIADIDPATGLISGKPQVLTQRFVEDVFMPTWSPDGTTLVYATNRNVMVNAAPVLTFRRVGTGQERDVQLSPVVGSIRAGSGWSRDSRYLYVDGWTQDGDTATFRVDPRLGEVKAIAPGICQNELPGGTALLCVETGPDSTKANLTKLDLGTGTKVLLKGNVPRSVIARPLSPDGRSLLCAPDRDGTLHLISLGEEQDRELFRTNSAEQLIPIDWLPGYIAFGRVEPDRITYWILHLNDGSAVQIMGTNLSAVVHANYVAMRFHPGGKQIVFVSNEGQNELWALDNPIPAQPASRSK